MGTESEESAGSFEFADGNAVLELLRRAVPARVGVFTAAVVSTVVWRLSNLVYPYLLGLFTDLFVAPNEQATIPLVPETLVPATQRGQFELLATVFAGLVVVQVVAHGLKFLTWRWFQQSTLHELRVEAYRAMQRLEVAVFEVEGTGDVMSVLNNDVNQLRTFLDEGLQSVFQVSAFFVGLVVLMVGLHWQLTLVVSLFAPVMFLVIRAYQRLIEPRYDERRGAVGRVNNHIQAVVSGIRTVKAFGAEPRERDRLEARSKAFWRADWAAAKLSGVFFPARQLVSLGAMLSIVAVGGSWVLFGPPFVFTQPLSPGTFITFYFLGQMLVGQMGRVGDIVDGYVDAKASAKRVFGLLAREPDGDDRESVSLAPVDGHVSYDDVTFSYPGERTPAIEGVSFDAEPDDYVGIVGPTGAGKSTVVKLLLGLYEPDTGTVRVDGVDVTAADTVELREAIGYVGQEPFLFDMTVRENIAYGDPTAGDAAIQRAAGRANAAQFIEGLPDGYETTVGEEGVALSGGQRQRIAIARAILRDPAILVLDEATSHVDNRTELLIQEGLRELIVDRTTIAIAHRLSTVRAADTILVFDDGEIVERGTHEELVDDDGLYADLWALHLGDADSLPALSADPVGPADE